MKLIIQADPSTETAFPCWRKLIWWLFREKAAHFYISTEQPQERRNRTKNWIKNCAPELAEYAISETMKGETDNLGSNTFFLSFSPPAENSILFSNRPTNCKLIQAVNASSGNFSEQLELCWNAGVEFLLTDRLPDEISVSLPDRLEEYYLKHFVFLPPVVEENLPFRKKESTNKCVLILTDSNSGTTACKTNGNEDFDFALNLPRYREPFLKTGKIDCLNIGPNKGLYDSGLLERLCSYPVWVIAVSDPQASLNLSILGKIGGVRIFHREPTACSPFRFAGAGISLDENIGIIESVRESLQWLLVLIKGDSMGFDSAIDDFSKEQFPLDIYSAEKLWKWLCLTIENPSCRDDKLNSDSAEFPDESLFWHSIFKTQAGLCNRVKEAGKTLRPGLLLTTGRKALFRSPFFETPLLKAAEILCNPIEDSVSKPNAWKSFSKQIERILADYLISISRPGWECTTFMFLEKFPWLVSECEKSVTNLSSSQVHFENLLKILYSALLNGCATGDAGNDSKKKLFASIVVDGLKREKLISTSSIDNIGLYLRSLVLQGKVDKAENFAKEVYSKNPLAENLFCIVGQALASIGDKARAEKYMERDMRKDKISVFQSVHYAELLVGRGNVGKSIQIVENLEKSGQSVKGAITRLAKTYISFEESVLNYLQPDGEFLSHLEKFAGLMEAEIARGCQRQDTWLNLSRIEGWIGRPGKALQTLRHGIEVSNQNMARILALETASCLGRNHTLEQGLPILEELASKRGLGGGFTCELARSFLNSICHFYDPESRLAYTSQIELMEGLLDESIAEGNTLPFAFNFKAHCQILAGEPEAAIRTMETAEANNAAGPVARISNAHALWWFGHPDLAREEIAKKTSQLSGSSLELFFRAATLAVCGFGNESLLNYRALYDAEPFFFDPNRQKNRNLWFWQMAACHALGDDSGEAFFEDLSRNYDPLFEIKSTWLEGINYTNGEIYRAKGRLPLFRYSADRPTTVSISFSRKHPVLQTVL